MLSHERYKFIVSGSFLLLRIRNKKIFVGDLVAIFNVIHNFIHKTAVLVDNYWE